MSGSSTIPTTLLCETPEISSNCTNGGIAQQNSNSAEHPSLLASPLLSVRKKKIVLHIDLNNTILVSDAVTKQGTMAALEYFLSTVTWGRMNKGEINTSSRNLKSLLGTQTENMRNIYLCLYQHCDKLLLLLLRLCIYISTTE